MPNRASAVTTRPRLRGTSAVCDLVWVAAFAAGSETGSGSMTVAETGSATGLDPGRCRRGLGCGGGRRDGRGFGMRRDFGCGGRCGRGRDVLDRSLLRGDRPERGGDLLLDLGLVGHAALLCRLSLDLLCVLGVLIGLGKQELLRVEGRLARSLGDACPGAGRGEGRRALTLSASWASM